jgi:hypothetical protein
VTARLPLLSLLALAACGPSADGTAPAATRRPSIRSVEARAPDSATRAVPQDPPPATASVLLRDPFLTPEEEAELARPPEPPPAPARKVVRTEVRLEALIVPDDGRRKVAVVNGHPFAEGERIGGEQLVAIGSDHIELVSPKGVRRRIYFDKRRTDAAPDAPNGPTWVAPQEAMQRTHSR